MLRFYFFSLSFGLSGLILKYRGGGFPYVNLRAFLFQGVFSWISGCSVSNTPKMALRKVTIWVNVVVMYVCVCVGAWKCYKVQVWNWMGIRISLSLTNFVVCMWSPCILLLHQHKDQHQHLQCASCAASKKYELLFFTKI